MNQSTPNRKNLKSKWVISPFRTWEWNLICVVTKRGLIQCTLAPSRSYLTLPQMNSLKTLPVGPAVLWAPIKMIIRIKVSSQRTCSEMELRRKRSPVTRSSHKIIELISAVCQIKQMACSCRCQRRNTGFGIETQTKHNKTLWKQR